MRPKVGLLTSGAERLCGVWMRVLLVRPPAYSKTLEYPSGPRFGLPIGLLYLAAYLESAGVDVRIYDALIDFDWEDVKRNGNGQYHLGASWPRLVSKVLEVNPDIVGITNPVSDMAEYATRTAREIKARCPNVFTVIGGPHATSCPGDFLPDDGAVDYVVRGEGEETFARLIEALSGSGDPTGIPGITFMDGGQIRSNPPAPFIRDLDGLPLPAYHLVPMERYFDLVRDGYPTRFMFEYPGSDREVSIITSRGCPFHCVFCGNHLHMGRVWRHNSVEYVLRHMELLISKYGVRHFHLEDDNVGLDSRRLHDLVTGIIAKRWNITWDTANGIRLHGLSRELLEGIKASGCTYLEFGIESGSQETIDDIIGKGIKLDEAERVLRTCKDLRINVHALYVVGFPGETRAAINATFRFARRALMRYDAIPHVCMARPLPGTELYEICEEKGYLTEPMLPDMGSMLRTEVFPRVMIRTEHFDPETLGIWMARFNREIIALCAVKTLGWLLLHPRVIPAVTRKFLHDSRRGIVEAAKRAFYGGLFFKFSYLDGRLRKLYDNISGPSRREAPLENSADQGPGDIRRLV
jgi:anaerobic magnesium-protoporphyrin IX monomethyl ester cyclase